MTHDHREVNSINRILTLALAASIVLVAAGIATAQKFAHRPRANKFTQQSSNAAASAMFGGGRDLIDEAQWAKAEEKFAQYIAAYPNEKNLDAAMYWMAYSQFKLRKFNQSKDTIDRLLKVYDKSIWKEDAEMLLAQLPNSPQVKIDPAKIEALTAPAVKVETLEEPATVTVNVAPVAAPAVAVAVQNPAEVQERAAASQERMAEAQARMAEAQARAEERTRAAQERTLERVKIAQEKIKDKDFKYDFDFDFNFDFDWDNGLVQGKPGSDDPSEFKIVVLQELFEADPQRGIAVATEWLKAGSTQTVSCRRAALTLLARHGGKAAIPIIMESAKNDPELKVRTRAISVLGSFNDDSVVDPLRDFALNAQQSEISEAALYALSNINTPRAASVLADIALSNKPVPLRKTAIASIAGRQGEPAVDALLKIYDSSPDLDIRKSVIFGFARRKSDRAGAKLLEIARSADNVELRKAAISAIGRRGGDTAVDSLLNLYDSEKNEDIRDQILNSLSNSNDPRVIDKLIEIAKNPQTPIERRRRAVMLLSNGSRTKNPKVIAFLEDLLKQ
jgi:HEAT repeat protein/TolA-binding protein